MKASGRVLSVNVGKPREFDYNGRPAQSAIWKQPVSGRVAVRGVNLEGDDQADRRAHGGPDKAVYAYAVEDLQWWEKEEGRPFAHAEFGENLTTEGINLTGALVGERLKIGTTTLEVSEPRVPCWRLSFRMNDKLFVRKFMEAGRPGTYLRIIEEGELGSGDEILIIETPDHGLTVGDVFRIFSKDHDEAEKLLPVPQISDAWKDWARKRMARQV